MNILKSLCFLCLFLSVISCSTVIKEPQVESRALYDALENEDIVAFKKALQMESEVRNLSRFHDSKGNTILHLLVKKHDIDSLLELAKSYTLPYNHPNNKYVTPLSLAVSLGHCQIFELLLIKGADPLVTMEGHPTILVKTVIDKRYSCMETLLINSDAILKQGDKDWEALHYAAYLNDLRAAKLLSAHRPHFLDQATVEEGVPFVSQESFAHIGKLNPFHIAVRKSHLAMAKLLLGAYPSYISSLTSNGTSNEELANMSSSPNMIVWIGSKRKGAAPLKGTTYRTAKRGK